MPPTYLLPVITTKEQIGLGNVTNDEQLKKASNLEDITDASVARDNLGLGDAATKNIGAGLDQVAPGDHDHSEVDIPDLDKYSQSQVDSLLTEKSDISHDHDGVYEPIDATILRQADIDDTPVNGATSVPPSSNWAYDHAAENDLELQRLAGIDLTQNALLQMYHHNCKEIATCESGEAWADLDWEGNAGATHGDDTTNYKVGSQGISITTSSNKAIRLEKVMDLAKFENGAESTADDYIELSVYTEDAGTAISTIIYFPCNAAGTITDYYAYNFHSLLSNGWNYIKIQKSAFTTGGSPDWADVKGVIMQNNTTGGEVSYTFDAIRMTRKDTEDAKPNPLQVEVDETMERVMEVSSGTLYLGYDGNDLVLKAFEHAYTLSDFTFDNVEFSGSVVSDDGFITVGVWQYQDADNYNAFFLRMDELKTRKAVSGSFTYISSTAFALDAGDEVDFSGNIKGKSIYGHASKTGSSANIYGLSTVDYGGEKVGLVIYEDVSLVSFVASSSSIMVNQ